MCSDNATFEIQICRFKAYWKIHALISSRLLLWKQSWSHTSVFPLRPRSMIRWESKHEILSSCLVPSISRTRKPSLLLYQEFQCKSECWRRNCTKFVVMSNNTTLRFPLPSPWVCITISCKIGLRVCLRVVENLTARCELNFFPRAAWKTGKIAGNFRGKCV